MCWKGAPRRSSSCGAVAAAAAEAQGLVAPAIPEPEQVRFACQELAVAAKGLVEVLSCLRFQSFLASLSARRLSFSS